MAFRSTQCVKRNEYRGYILEDEGDRCVGLSKNSGSLDLLEGSGPVQRYLYLYTKIRYYKMTIYIAVQIMYRQVSFYVTSL